MRLFPEFSTRTRAIIVSSILTFSYFFSHQNYFVSIIEQYTFSYSKLILPIFFGFVMFVGMLWVVNFKLSNVQSFFTVVLYSGYCIFIISLFFEYIFSTQTMLGQITLSFNSTIIVFFTNYFIILTLNILNLSYLQNIPLEQVAKASIYIINLIIEYLGFFLIISTDVFYIYKLILIFGVVLYSTYSSIWTLKIETNQKFLSSISMAIFTIIATIALSIWPITTEIVALILVVLLYILTGITLEQKDKIGKYIWLEYISLVVIIICILYISSKWGINGHIV